ncbi:MAG: transposase [Gloeobacteraceae cyanobacterium ES-bin-316]|nr:transposase [Ferruginibacter sp.]
MWFKKWVLERQTYQTLSRDSGLSRDTLQRIFYAFLDKAPEVVINKWQDIHLRLDATYFKKFCVICYQDNDIGYTQLYRFSRAELYDEIKEDLMNLLKLGLSVKSITCDGHKATLKAIKKVMPKVTIQRCLVHIQRMSLIWLTRHPRSIAGKELRAIVLMMNKIKTNNDKIQWTRELYHWYKLHDAYLKEKSINTLNGKYWYKHKFLRRSYFSINRALPNMFHYLEDIDIPKSTNGIESFFGHLKNHLDLHRGLTPEHRKGFIKWYFYLKNQVSFV